MTAYKTTDQLIDNVNRARDAWSHASLTGKPERFQLYKDMMAAENALGQREAILSIAVMLSEPAPEEPYRGPICDADGHDVS